MNLSPQYIRSARGVFPLMEHIYVEPTVIHQLIEESRADKTHWVFASDMVELQNLITSYNSANGTDIKLTQSRPAYDQLVRDVIAVKETESLNVVQMVGPGYVPGLRLELDGAEIDLMYRSNHVDESFVIAVNKDKSWNKFNFGCRKTSEDFDHFIDECLEGQKSKFQKILSKFSLF